ncbi:MAG TPA: 3-oxoacyl-ACP synthase [Trueperaceae bacterium]|jgi:3-oxoacyl-[acyl-carrier-protein] synthase-3
MSGRGPGVTGIGTYLPAGRMSAAELAAASGLPEWVVREKLGIESRVMPGSDDHPTAMGVRAARAALEDAGVRPEDVDVVVSITEEYKEYAVWTAGIKLAHDVGAVNAYAYDVGQKCGTAVLALKLARDMIAADDGVDTVLVAGGYRNGDLVDLTDPHVRFMYNLGAGAAAFVVQRGRGHELLGSAFRTDGSFSLDVLVPVGGTVAPVTPENAGQFRLRVTDPAGMRERLEAKSMDNFVGVVEDAVARSGARLEDVAYVAMLHVKRSAHEALLARLGLPLERSIYLSGYGHIGQVDQALSLELARQQGLLRPGDLVVLVAAGVGYVWNAICLRWDGAAGPGERSEAEPVTDATPPRQGVSAERPAGGPSAAPEGGPA